MFVSWEKISPGKFSPAKVNFFKCKKIFFCFVDKKVLSLFCKILGFSFRVVFNQRIELKPSSFAEKLVGLVNKAMPWSVICLLLLTF